MSPYDIIDCLEQAQVRPVYRLKNCRERLARYSNHLTFLTKCREHGIIPNGLRVTLPVRSTKAENIAKRKSEAHVRERIGEAHRRKGIFPRSIAQLITDYPCHWTLTNGLKLITFAGMPWTVSTKTPKTDRSGSSATLKSRGTQSLNPLDHRKLTVNLSHRQLTPLEKEVLALDCPLQSHLGLFFAVADSTRTRLEHSRHP